MPPSTKKLQFEIARHFELAHHINKIQFVVEPNTFDFWEPYREDDASLVPPRRQEMTVLPDGFDSRRLTPADSRKFKALAEATGFIYLGIRHNPDYKIQFLEKQSPAEGLGEDLAVTWIRERPFRKLPKTDDVTPAELIEAAKIFMRFIKLHDGMHEPQELQKVGAILKELHDQGDLRLAKADAEFMELMSYITTVFLLEGV